MGCKLRLTSRLLALTILMFTSKPAFRTRRQAAPAVMQEYIVKTVNNKRSIKIVTIERGQRATRLELPRYSPVGPDDILLLPPSNANSAFVKGERSNIKVKPHFEVYDKIKLADFVFDIRIAELISPEDFDNYSRLEKYHYRSSLTANADGSETEGQSPQSGGRKTILMLSVKLTNSWEAAGYVELQMPLMMCKPRHDLFKLPYHNPAKGVSWDIWNSESIQRHVNQIVRIGRIVTAPDLRGLGFAKYLIKAAREYSVERWHIKGRQPVFMEISAEMLKYIDFVTSSGFRFVGLTEGNVRRIHKDLQYISRGYDISSGIMSLQKKYLVAFKNLATTLGLTFDHALRKLDGICRTPAIDDALNELTPSEYYLFKSILRLPIPYFLMGLDDYSMDYLDRALERKEGIEKPKKIPAPQQNVLKVQKLSVTATFDLPESQFVRAIMSGFGVKMDNLTQTIVEDLAFDVARGNILFVGGSSGSGKSVVIRFLNNSLDKNLQVTYLQNNNDRFTVSLLKPIESTLPLIEYFAQQFGMERSISALNRAGLSEAFVYLKPYHFLSRGQQYRARFAELILEDRDVWLLDEFCSDLDVINSSIVANNLRKLVIRYSKICVVAAANHEHFIDALKPTKIIVMGIGKQSRIVTLREYKNELFIHK